MPPICSIAPSAVANVTSDEGMIEDALRIYGMDAGLALHRAAEAAMLGRLPLRGTVLDLGCNDGGFSQLAFTHFRQTEVIGSDYDIAALAQCQGRRVHAGLIASDATRLPFREGAFAAVVCNSVLTHIEELSHSLREIARVLAAGGVLAATVPTPAFHEMFAPVRFLHALGLRTLATRVAAAYDRKWHQRHFHGEAAWRTLLEGVGLSLESWTEYLDRRGSLKWSSLFLVVRLGIGRLTLGALLRRLMPAGAARTRRVHRQLAILLAPSMGPVSAGGSALLIARRRGPTGAGA